MVEEIWWNCERLYSIFDDVWKTVDEWVWNLVECIIGGTFTE